MDSKTYSIFDPRMKDVVRTIAPERSLERLFEADRYGHWAAIAWPHQVICFMCECRAWDGKHGIKGAAMPKLEVREVYEKEVDDWESGQRYRIVMFGLGCPDNQVNSVKEVWRRLQLWRAGHLCWDYSEYAEQRAVLEAWALSLKQKRDRKFAWHMKGIGEPIEGETFGQGRVLQLLNNGEGDAASKQLPGVIELAGS